MDGDGQNAISVSPGANRTLSPEDVEAAASTLRTADVVLCQLEIPLDSVHTAARYASRLILNAAPAAPLDRELLQQVDVLVVNETELATLGGSPTPDGPTDAIFQARAVRGPKAVVITLGAQGAAVVSASEAAVIAAPAVHALDTTGAGDAFCAALAVRLASGDDVTSAARYAVLAGAAATLKQGAQPSLPYPTDTEALK